MVTTREEDLSLEEQHNKLSDRFDKLTLEIKGLSITHPRYGEAWEERRQIREEMYILEKSITG